MNTDLISMGHSVSTPLGNGFRIVVNVSELSYTLSAGASTRSDTEICGRNYLKMYYKK